MEVYLAIYFVIIHTINIYIVTDIHLYNNTHFFHSFITTFIQQIKGNIKYFYTNIIYSLKHNTTEFSYRPFP